MDKPDVWPLQDRVKFLPWIKATFRYVKEDGDGEARTLFNQQKFVRDYLQHGSPYRGLLLLHSLGVGKTCAAIAAAEALRPTASSIFVMTKKMLRGTFIGEVPACSSPELLRRQKWSLVNNKISWTKNQNIVDKIPAKMIRHNNGVWIAADDGIEYDDLDPGSQGQIDAQIEAVVASSFNFIHYNGVSKDRVDKMFVGGKNPFDGAVVIIDEVHNFISRIMNKRIVRPIYDRLLDAVDCKIVLLSGTPIVNRTAELAYLVNLVQGKTIVHSLRLRDESTQEAIDEALESNYADIQSAVYDPGSKSVRVVFAPHGFEMVPGSEGMTKRSTRSSGGADGVEKSLQKAGMKVLSRSTYAALPLPDDVDEFDARFVDWEQGSVLNPTLLQRRIVGAVSSYSKLDSAYFASVSPIEIVHAQMSGLQFIKYAQLRYEERRRERNVQRLQARAGRGKTGEANNLGQVYRTFSLALCTFVFPDEIERPFKFQMRQRFRDISDGAEIDKGQIDREYETGLELATRRLKAEKPECLRVDGTLGQHSPKFLALVNRLDKSPGPVLVYSQFRRAEGIGLLSAVFDLNDWSELRLTRTGDGAWIYKQVSSPTKQYITLRTEEDPECNRLLLHIFNNDLEQLPRITRDSLPGTTNLHGELARVIMITSSGAEGISLKNVRQVHMIEGYWNHNRIDQVIGRAVRARSHLGLPVDERHVDVYLYLANFTDEQRLDHAIMHVDKGLTSDQYVHAVAMKKKFLTDQVVALIKGASVDCMVHAEGDEESACFQLPNNMPLSDIFRTPAFIDDIDDATYAKRMTKLVVVQVDNVKYYMDANAGILYDYDQLKNENVLVKVGQV